MADTHLAVCQQTPEKPSMNAELTQRHVSFEFEERLVESDA